MYSDLLLWCLSFTGSENNSPFLEGGNLKLTKIPFQKKLAKLYFLLQWWASPLRAQTFFSSHPLQQQKDLGVGRGEEGEEKSGGIYHAEDFGVCWASVGARAAKVALNPGFHTSGGPLDLGTFADPSASKPKIPLQCTVRSGWVWGVQPTRCSVPVVPP